MTTCYLAGPMRGYPDFNFPAFHAAAADLRAKGWTVLSPAEADLAQGFDPTKNTLDGFDMSAALVRDVEMVAKSDAVILLPGWRKSKGSGIEYAVARYLGRKCYEYGDPLRPLPGSVLDEARALVHGDRGNDYGHPSIDFGRTAAMWSALFGIPITARQIPLAMIAVKLSRLAQSPGHRDSAVDIAGYAETWGMVVEREGAS